MNMITAGESISAFINKLSSCISCIGSGTYADFPQLGAVSKGKISLIIVIKYKSMCRCYSSPSGVGFRLQAGEVSVSLGWMQDRTHLSLT